MVGDVGGVTISPAGVKGNINLEVTVQINGEAAIVAQFDNMNGDGFVNIANRVLKGKISAADIGTISKFSTSIKGLTK